MKVVVGEESCPATVTRQYWKVTCQVIAGLYNCWANNLANVRVISNIPPAGDIHPNLAIYHWSLSVSALI